MSIWHLVTVIALALVPFLRAGATNEAELTLRPPHELLPPTFWEQHGWTVVLGSLGLVLVIGIIVWLLCRPRPPIIVPPEVVARRELLALQPKPEDGAVVSQATQVLRRYIAAAFELSPNEFTTAEFCRLLAGEERIGNELAAALGEFLRDCDERKFNPHPEQPPASGVVARALQLLDQAQARRALVQERDALAASQTPMPARA